VGADLAISVLIGAGYVIAAGTVAIGLIAIVVWLFVLPQQAVQMTRRGWWADVALAVTLLALLAAVASWLSGCSVAVAYQRAEHPPAEQAEASPTTPSTDDSVLNTGGK